MLLSEKKKDTGVWYVHTKRLYLQIVSEDAETVPWVELVWLVTFLLHRLCRIYFPVRGDKTGVLSSVRTAGEFSSC